MSEAVAANRRRWNELAGLHPGTAHYEEVVEQLHTGGSALRNIELEEVGDVNGRRLLHLQCHIGTQSVSWARRGAQVTAVDYAPQAIVEARRLAAELDVSVDFIESDVLELSPSHTGTFDVVYTSWGVLGWLPDINRWAEVLASLLNPGGFLYVAEFHPVAWMFDEKADAVRLRYDYFGDEPLIQEDDGSYADRSMPLTNRRSYNWYYMIGGVVTALAEAGMRLEFLHELPRTPEPILAFLVPDETMSEPRWFTTPPGMTNLPLAFTLRARRE